jgi:hypothetical protein
MSTMRTSVEKDGWRQGQLPRREMGWRGHGESLLFAFLDLSIFSTEWFETLLGSRFSKHTKQLEYETRGSR